MPWRQYFTTQYIREKWQHAGFQKYFRNISWIFFTKIASMFISFITTAFVARNLGPTNYGELNYALSFTGLFGFLATLGIDQVLYRDLIKFPEKKNEYMGTAVVLRLFAGIITVLICLIFAFFLSPWDVSLVLIFILSLTFIFNSFQILNYEFQAEIKSKYPSIVSLIVVLILNILKITVIVSGQGVIYLALVLLLEPILYGLGFLYFRIKKFGSISQWKFKKEIAWSIIKDSSPLIFASAFFAVYSRIDQIMIKNILDTESVGLYSSAVAISEVWYFIPNIIAGAMFPAIINAKKVSENLYYERIKKLFYILLLVSILTALPTTILSKYFISIIFGTSFLGAMMALKIYVWSNVGAVLNIFVQQLLIAENMTKIISISIFLGMITNVILNLFLIQKFDIPGAAFASLISYVIPFTSLLLFKQPRKIILNIFKKHDE